MLDQRALGKFWKNPVALVSAGILLVFRLAIPNPGLFLSLLLPLITPSGQISMGVTFSTVSLPEAGFRCWWDCAAHSSAYSSEPPMV